jgi:hypothetical protein
MASKLVLAMTFLEEQSIIHRDVAARNVLVGAEATDVKISDLGAARSVHQMNEASSGGVYTATTDHNPARWMSLEALRDAKFSHKSDVFSFGVLLWEILSMGQTPWGAFTVRDFSGALQRGERLQCPAALVSDAAAGFIYAKAGLCWARRPEKRPPFRQLSDALAIQLQVLAMAASSPLHGLCSGSGGGGGREHPPLQNRGGGGHAADGAATASPVLDDDGCVLDAPTSMAADTNAASVALDDDGYVADTTGGYHVVSTTADPALVETAHLRAGLPPTTTGAAVAAARQLLGESGVALPVTRLADRTLGPDETRL